MLVPDCQIFLGGDPAAPPLADMPSAAPPRRFAILVICSGPCMCVCACDELQRVCVCACDAQTENLCVMLKQELDHLPLLLK
jgi:hypothetical protein